MAERALTTATRIKKWPGGGSANDGDETELEDEENVDAKTLLDCCMGPEDCDDEDGDEDGDGDGDEDTS